MNSCFSGGHQDDNVALCLLDVQVAGSAITTDLSLVCGQKSLNAALKYAKSAT